MFYLKISHQVAGGSERQGRKIGQFGRKFWDNKPEIIRGKKIILIDDVRTTAATMSEAKKVPKTGRGEKSRGV